ncbi:hypothetical protein Tco_0558638 [Tanacetum coccineum]
MDGQGAGYCIVLGSAPLGPYFSVSASVMSSYVDRGGAGKGFGRIVYAILYGAGQAYLLSLLTLEGKDHHRCLLQISKPARPGWSACIHQLRGILRSSLRLGRVFFPTSRVGVLRKEIWLQAFFRRPLNVGHTASKMEETLMGVDMSSHRSSWYWTYSSIRFQPIFFGERAEVELSELVEFPLSWDMLCRSL